MARPGKLALTAVAATVLLALATPEATGSAALAQGPRDEPSRRDLIHPTFPLLDAEGEHALDSGSPVSAMATCGDCHDTGFIAETSFHADVGLGAFGEAGSVADGRPWDSGPGFFGRWDPTTYRYLTPAGDETIDLGTAEWVAVFGARHVGGGPAQWSRYLSGQERGLLADVRTTPRDPETHIQGTASGEWDRWDWSRSGGAELNCFLCHVGAPDNDARLEALAAGQFEWASTATLLGSGAVARSGSDWVWQPDAFDDDGHVVGGLLGVRDPSDEHCGQCHGLVHDDDEEPLLSTGCKPQYWSTERTGQIVSPQRMSESGMNLAGKDKLTRSWDVHSERLVDCVDCHYSVNNPIYHQPTRDAELDHLSVDARRMDIADYLYRPSHELARGAEHQDRDAVAAGWGASADLRCTSCHTPEAAHAWLPYRERHFDALSCESCHMPHMHAPTRRQYDWTVVRPDGGAKIECRGVEGESGAVETLITGYEPVLLPRQDADGSTSLAPYNLVTSWYWIAGEPPRPVRMSDLGDAFLEDGGYHPEIVAALDDDDDGELSDAELELDTPEAVDVIAGRLAALGMHDPHIAAEVQPYPINHGAAHGEWATKDCQACHRNDSRVTRPFMLASYVPGDVMPQVVPDATTTLSGEMTVDDDGALYLRPVSAHEGLYVIGHDRVRWIGWLGAAAALAVMIGMSAHGGLRVMHSANMARREPELRRVYMYTAYERSWHWLQALVIALLILTGMLIHMPDLFGMVDYAVAVRVHNVLGFLLLANAALAVFYHVAGGGIRRYLPEPHGFFAQAIAQVVYYARGIMRGDDHPFEKHPGKRLNPLQQVTYLVILNVLLPVQIFTGVMMWGAQRWPTATEKLGGLAMLAPVHTLVTWLFVAFLILHIYLTTTGHTPLANIRAMVVGWDEVEVRRDDASKDADGGSA